MKIKYKPWMSLVILAVLFGIVSEMDYRDALEMEAANNAARLHVIYAVRTQ